MRRVQRFADLLRDQQGFVHGNRTFREAVRQCRAMRVRPSKDPMLYRVSRALATGDHHRVNVQNLESCAHTESTSESARLTKVSRYLRFRVSVMSPNRSVLPSLTSSIVSRQVSVDGW